VTLGFEVAEPTAEARLMSIKNAAIPDFPQFPGCNHGSFSKEVKNPVPLVLKACMILSSIFREESQVK